MISNIRNENVIMTEMNQPMDRIAANSKNENIKIQIRSHGNIIY